jgi:hypothetical protein
MFRFFRFWFGALARCFGPRQDLLLENLALRQQLTVLKRRHPKPKLGLFDKLFWVSTRRFWSAWKQALIIVTPETVVRWHRAGFRMYWSLISRVKNRVGRKKALKGCPGSDLPDGGGESELGRSHGFMASFSCWVSMWRSELSPAE